MEKILTIHQKLFEIQQNLIAPKGNYNSFGKYKYRSAEDILEAVKPHLKKLDMVLTLTDEVVCVGDKNYIKASATIYSGDNDGFKTTAYAREALTKKGMDDAQITGSASSYARKYALNGLFAIDDTKDADTQDNTEKPKAQPKAKPVLCPEHDVEMKKVRGKDGKTYNAHKLEDGTWCKLEVKNGK